MGERRGTDIEYAEAEVYLKQHRRPSGQTGHCELDLEPLFRDGVDALRAALEQRLGLAAACSGEGEEVEAYRSFLLALEGFSRMIENAAKDAREKGFADLADSCARIAHEPPQTFRDAIQLLWFALFAVMFGEDVGLVVPVHIDLTLFPFFQSYRANVAFYDD